MLVVIKNYDTESFTFVVLRIFELYTSKVGEMFVYKHTETIEYVKS